MQKDPLNSLAVLRIEKNMIATRVIEVFKNEKQVNELFIQIIR